MVRAMEFPVGESSANVLPRGRPSTPRVYRVAQRVETRLGRLEVRSVTPGQGLERHPFVNELTEQQKACIGEHPYDLICLVAV